MSNFVPRTREINHGQRNQSYQSSACREERINKWLTEQLGCTPTTVSKDVPMTISQQWKHILKNSELLNVELTKLVKTKKCQMKYPSC